jgi:hypothetical protein
MLLKLSDITRPHQNSSDEKKPEHPVLIGYSGLYRFLSNLVLVQMERLELSRPKSPPPQECLPNQHK